MYYCVSLSQIFHVCSNFAADKQTDIYTTLKNNSNMALYHNYPPNPYGFAHSPFEAGTLGQPYFLSPIETIHTILSSDNRNYSL